MTSSSSSSSVNQCASKETCHYFKPCSRASNKSVEPYHEPEHETLSEIARVSIEFQKRVTDLKVVPYIDSLASQLCDKISINTNYGDDFHETTNLTGLLSLGACKNHHYHSADSTQPITSLYLMMTRSMGLKDEDALNLVS